MKKATTTAKTPETATWRRTLLRVTPVFAAAALVLAACGGGEKKNTFADISGKKIVTIIPGQGNQGGTAPATPTPVPVAKVPDGITVSAVEGGKSTEIAKSGQPAEAVVLAQGQTITVADAQGRLGDANSTPVIKKYDAAQAEQALPGVTVQVTGAAGSKTVAVTLDPSKGDTQWHQIKITFAGIEGYTLTLQKKGSTVERNACAPAIPKAGDQVVLDYKYLADTTEQWVSTKADPDEQTVNGKKTHPYGTIYPNGNVVATLDFAAGSAGKIKLTSKTDTDKVSLFHPQSADIDPATGHITAFETARVVFPKNLVGFGYESPTNPAGTGPDWRATIAMQNVAVGEDIKPMTVKMVGMGKIPSLMETLYGKAVAEDNAVVVTMNVTGKRLPDKKITIAGKEINTCHYSFKMRRTHHTIAGTDTERMVKGNPPVGGEDIGPFMPQLDGEFWSSNQVPHTVAKAKYWHVTGIGADGKAGKTKNLNGQEVPVNPYSDGKSTQQSSEEFTVKSFKTTP